MATLAGLEKQGGRGMEAHGGQAAGGCQAGGLPAARAGVEGDTGWGCARCPRAAWVLQQLGHECHQPPPGAKAEAAGPSGAQR